MVIRPTAESIGTAQEAAGDQTVRQREQLAARFWSHVEKGAEHWLWTAASDDGYGRIQRGAGDRTIDYAHRVSYELLVGPIPDGLTIDHLCLVTMCVRPDHLEAVTLAENVRRQKRRWTHCIHGHEFTVENTYWRREGRRMCRTCARERKRVAA